MNAALLASNVGALGVFLNTNDTNLGLGMLGASTALASTMGITLTAAIGDRKSVV